MSDKHPVVECRGLAVGYDRAVPLYRGLDLELRRGEVVSLLGVNGSGKSTLIKTLCGFMAPAGGEVVIEGRPMSCYSRAELAQTIGVVLTDRAVDGGLTVYDTVALGRYQYTDFFGRLSENDRAVIDGALEEVGIASKRNSYLARMSDGERQKVFIAKALAQDCPVIVLDEPTAFLDVRAKIGTMRLLADIARNSGRAILLSTHDLSLAVRFSDRLWVLDPESGMVCGSVDEVVGSGG
ncbi:MAG: ABC transporter ATP-binding protein, partial [Rikenellaceae bacterium]|nr:ABC transporter ATP-binding protein [Rikenellaceae bacterium]